ncbi:MAG TPA: glycosyltransferase family 2 protein [Flavobacterium sp.]|nr:glycosyltransferase family 2 protein [Flavobacterium sp.]
MIKNTYIILLNHHGFSDTIACIQSLQKLSIDTYKIVVIDNSQSEKEWNKMLDFARSESLDYISFNESNCNDYQQQKVVFIKASENKGFAHGNNLGIKFAMRQEDTWYLWILNNDTVVQSDSLTALVDYHLQHPNTILGSKLLYYHNPDKIQAVGGSFNKNLYICTHIGEGLSKDTPKKQLKQIDYPLGASMFVSRDFIDDVGFLNEKFFLYYEELDWCERGIDENYVPDWCEASVVYHKEGASIGSSYKKKKSFFSEIQLFISRKKFIKKHYSLDFKFYFSSLLLIANRIIKGRFKLAFELFKITFNDVK